MTAHKKSLKEIQDKCRRVDLLTREGNIEGAQAALRQLVDAAMLLAVDLRTLEVQSRLSQYYDRAFPADSKGKRERVNKDDQATIVEMTRKGFSMREIGRVIKRTPSLVWAWQQKLGVKRSGR